MLLPAIVAAGQDAPKRPAPKKPAKNQIVAKVKAIDEKNDAITLTGEEMNGKTGPDRTFTLANDAKVRIDGGFVRLIDVPIGSEVTVVLNAEKQVMSITVNAKKNAGE
jgi:hypothetical protein